MDKHDFSKPMVLELASGGKAQGYLPVADYAHNGECVVPILAVRGSRSGPVVCLTGGVHGDEFEGSVVIQELWKQLEPDELAGTIVGVPHVNAPAFESGARVGTLDHMDFNHVCPGRASGSITERIAYAFFTYISPHIDYLIDLHGGGNALKIAPIAIYREIGDDDLRRRTVALARSLGTELIWRGAGPGGESNTLTQETLRRGVPAVTLEMGGGGIIDASCLTFMHNAVRSSLAHLGMLDDRPLTHADQKTLDVTFLHSRNGGLYRSAVDLEERVSKGQVLGTVSDLYGTVTEEVTAPWEGLVVFHRVFPTIEPGGWAASIGKVIEGAVDADDRRMQVSCQPAPEHPAAQTVPPVHTARSDSKRGSP